MYLAAADGGDGDREKVTLEEMGGARMHCSSPLRDVLVKNEQEANLAGEGLPHLLPPELPGEPSGCRQAPATSGQAVEEIIPPDRNKPFDMYSAHHELVDERSFLEIRSCSRRSSSRTRRIDGARWGSSRTSQVQGRGAFGLGGQARGSSGVRRFKSRSCTWRTCPLHDRHQGGARRDHPAGAKMISAVAEASVPKICVVVRKAYGAACTP